jgi:hypothetical protein
MSFNFWTLASPISCTIGHVSSTSGCSLLKAVCSAQHSPLEDAPPLLCFHCWPFLAILRGTSLGDWISTLTLYTPQQWAAFLTDPTRPWKSPAVQSQFSHTKALLPHYRHSFGNGEWLWLPPQVHHNGTSHSPIVHKVPNPGRHLRCSRLPAPAWTRQ